MSFDINLLLRKVRKFGIFDFTLMKLGILSVGLVFGAVFSGFVLKYIAVFLGIFALSYIYLAVRLFFIKDDGKENQS